MADGKIRRYWDACNFIAVINGEPGRAETCREIMRDAAAGNIEIVTSAFTIAEVVRPKPCGGLQKEKDALVDAFFDQPYIVIVDVARVTMENARALQRLHGVRVKDSIHFAAAKFAGAAIFETYDTELQALNGKIGTPPILVRAPHFAGQSTLPGTT
jgi:predicted nucleic acid-binding protein